MPEGEEPTLLELVNPEIISAEGEQDGPEGCLSVPGVYGKVKRAAKVASRAMTDMESCSRRRGRISRRALSVTNWTIWTGGYSWTSRKRSIRMRRWPP